MIKLTVNGKSHSFDGDPQMPLLWYLRDELGLTGTKFGCGEGLCGACTIHMGGETLKACQTTMEEANNQTVLTIEGLSTEGDHPVQQVWRELNVPQCGYCQSGQIMRAVTLLAETPNPSDDDIDAVMSGNICRCGTFSRIREAIKQVAQKGAAQ